MSADKTQETPPAEARKCAGDGSNCLDWRHGKEGDAIIRCLCCGEQRFDTHRGFWGEPVCEDCFQAEVAKGCPCYDGETGQMIFPQARPNMKGERS